MAEEILVHIECQRINVLIVVVLQLFDPCQTITFVDCLNNPTKE